MMIAEFAAVFVTLWVGHSVGDHWVQTGCQAVEKGYGPPSLGKKDVTRRGQMACFRHVCSLTLTKCALLVILIVPFHIKLSPIQVVIGLLLDAVSHYWADRRWTLEELARWLDKGEFHDQGSDLVDKAGEKRPHLGTGRYALDQSWHHLWLFIAAWAMTVPIF